MITQRLTQLDIDRAAAILKKGGLVGIPTETVYGLGANGLNQDAVADIFKAKGRPQDNPLILHIPSADWLVRYCRDIPEAAYELADRFWPGPLTMILKRQDNVPRQRKNCRRLNHNNPLLKEKHAKYRKVLCIGQIVIVIYNTHVRDL